MSIHPPKPWIHRIYQRLLGQTEPQMEIVQLHEHRPVQVVIDGRPGGDLLIDIRNPLVNGRAVPAIGGSGTGLIGLTERVRLAGGELDHQATDGEFRLSARLPWPA